MKTLAGLLCAALALSACSSNKDQPSLASAVFEQLRPSKKAAPEKPKAPPRRITRAEIEELDLAMVRANLQGETVAPLMIARSVNKGYANYLSREGQSIAMRGTLVTATRGLGTDLLSVEHSPRDPLSVATLPENWPAQTARIYYVTGTGLKGQAIAVSCKVKRIKDHDIKIAETPFETTQMSEICSTDGGGEFVNHHFVDRSSGQIWVTQQWIGPDMAPLGLEVLEPLG